MIRHVTEITTADTKKTYTFSGVPNENPQLWKLSVSFSPVCNQTGRPIVYSYSSNHSTMDFFVERQALVDAKHLPVSSNDQPPKDPERTVEDLVIELLEACGFERAE